MFDRFKLLVSSERHCMQEELQQRVLNYQESSFIFFSRCSIQHLLRQGREAVIVPHELDVVSSEISEEAPTQAGDMVRGTSFETITVFLKYPLLLR